MKVFIDAGAHFGEVSRMFQKKHPDYKIYMFEPNPNINFVLPKNAILYNKAVWVEDVEKKFYISTKDKCSEGCSLIKEKQSGSLDKENPITVKCIDFNDWIITTFWRTDKIILKMDIEGAEYTVLPHMIDGGSINFIDKLYIEWHKKIDTYNISQHNNLLEKLYKIKTLSLKDEMKIL